MSLGHARAEREPGARRQLSEHVVSRRPRRRRRQNGDIKSNLLIGSEGRKGVQKCGKWDRREVIIVIVTID